MRTILILQHVKQWLKDGKTHFRTYAILDDGSEVQGYGNDYVVGEEVETYYDDAHDTYAMKKHLTNKLP